MSTKATDDHPFDAVGHEWSRPRKLTRVLEELGQPAPGRLTNSSFERLRDQLQRAGVEMATAEHVPIGTDRSGLTIHSKVRLRRRGSSPTAGGREVAASPLGDGEPPPVVSVSFIESIRIKDFKSFADAELPLAPLTVLIGANAAGKSNALEALQLLSWLASGQRLTQLRLDVSGQKLGLRGTSTELIRKSRDAPGQVFSLGCTLGHDAQGRSLKLQIDLAVDREGLRVAGEELDCPDDGSGFPLYRVTEPAHDGGREMQVAYNNFAKGGKKPLITCVDEIPVFAQLVSPARFGATHTRAQEDIPKATRRMSKTLSQVLFLDPDPKQMRGYTHTSEVMLGSDGTNLSAVLHRLTEQQGGKAQLLAFIQALPEQDILDLTYVKTPRDEVMVQLVESFGGTRQPTDAQLLSDGTLRVLAVAAALLSVPEGALVVIEEIDNGVHPSRAEGLMRRIRDVADRRNLRVLLTTHNPALLDSIPDAALPHVVACYRDEKDGSSRLARLMDLASYPELVARGRLGRLVTQGVVDRVLKQPPVTEAQRSERGLRWLQQRSAEEGS